MPDAVSPKKDPAPPSVKLTPLPSHIVTVFNAAEATRLSTGLPLLRGMCLTVGARPSPRYTGSPATVRDLTALVVELDAQGCDFRVRQVYRDQQQQGDLHRKYTKWLEAGRPTPGARGYDTTTMSTTAASAPNRSYHGCGMAMDIGLSSLSFADGLQGDAALDRLWDIAAPFGFTPIINEPRVGKSEAWHFDHLGPLRAVRDLFIAHKSESPDYRSASGIAAEVGCILLGTHTGLRQLERLAQARLLLHGVFVGLPDGKIGPKTRAGLKSLGIDTIGTTPIGDILSGMDALGVGFEGMRGL